jgi:hypothetical protein
MVAIASGRLRNLSQQCLHVEQHQPAQQVGPRDFLLELLRAHPVGEAGALHLHAARHRLAAREHLHARHSLASDGGQFHGAAVFHHRENRNDRRRREIDVMDFVAAVAKQLLGAQMDQFEVRRQRLPFVGRQRAE